MSAIFMLVGKTQDEMHLLKSMHRLFAKLTSASLKKFDLDAIITRWFTILETFDLFKYVIYRYLVEIKVGHSDTHAWFYVNNAFMRTMLIQYIYQACIVQTIVPVGRVFRDWTREYIKYTCDLWSICDDSVVFVWYNLVTATTIRLVTQEWFHGVKKLLTVALAFASVSENIHSQMTITPASYEKFWKENFLLLGIHNLLKSDNGSHSFTFISPHWVCTRLEISPDKGVRHAPVHR